MLDRKKGTGAFSSKESQLATSPRARIPTLSKEHEVYFKEFIVRLKKLPRQHPSQDGSICPIRLGEGSAVRKSRRLSAAEPSPGRLAPARLLLSHAGWASLSFPRPCGQRPRLGLPGRAAAPDAPDTRSVLRLSQPAPAAAAGPLVGCRASAPIRRPACQPPRRALGLPLGPLSRARRALGAPGRHHVVHTKVPAGLSLGKGDAGYPVVDAAALLAKQTEFLQGGVLPRVLIGVLRRRKEDVGGSACLTAGGGTRMRGDRGRGGCGDKRGERHSPK